MSRWFLFFLTLVYVGLVLFAVTIPAHAADPYGETRYCGTPLREADGSIKRDAKVVATFKSLHPKPPAALLMVPCDKWEADHVIPLACGGCDAVNNMQWLPTCLKRAKKYGKDQWERKIYGGFVVETSCGVSP